MVYATSWEVFTREAVRLFEAEPDKVRFCTRWSHSRGLLVLKVTDDKHCLKYKSRSSIILNRFEQLTSSLMGRMQARKMPTSAAAPTTAAKIESAGQQQIQAAGGSQATGGDEAKTPAKKKKSKKRK